MGRTVRTRKQIALAGIVAGAGMVSVALREGHRRQQRGLARISNALALASGEIPAPRADLDCLGDIPAPVAAYLRLALVQDQPLIRLAHFKQAGALRTDGAASRWMRFTATHTVAPIAIGFLWNARVRVAPWFHIRVRDELLRGRGAGQVSILSAITVASSENRFETSSGSLHRFLAEAVWYPTALLPSAKLRWRAVDQQTANATLTDNGLAVSLDFRFNDSGEIASIYAPARWGAFDGGYKQLPWEGRFGGYAKRDGMLVPSEGEVGWYLQNEWRPVWKGQVDSGRYEFADPLALT